MSVTTALPLNAPAYDWAARTHFLSMDQQDQAQAIRRMAALGQGDHTIARATHDRTRTSNCASFTRRTS